VEGERLVPVLGPRPPPALNRRSACRQVGKPHVSDMTTDPVCGMSLEESTAKTSTDYEGQRYYFCSDACREEFEAHPDEYAGREQGVGASP